MRLDPCQPAQGVSSRDRVAATEFRIADLFEQKRQLLDRVGRIEFGSLAEENGGPDRFPFGLPENPLEQITESVILIQLERFLQRFLRIIGAAVLMQKLRSAAPRLGV